MVLHEDIKWDISREHGRGWNTKCINLCSFDLTKEYQRSFVLDIACISKQKNITIYKYQDLYTIYNMSYDYMYIICYIHVVDDRPRPYVDAYMLI